VITELQVNSGINTENFTLQIDMNNRETHFRVWDTDSKKFWNGPFNNYLNEIFEKKRFIFQQYTGLKDKNGVRIYDGDILKETHYEDWTDENGFEYLGVVRHKVYSNNDAGNQFSGFVTFPNLNENKEYSGNPIKTNCEIVGNIFENPDLIKQTLE